MADLGFLPSVGATTSSASLADQVKKYSQRTFRQNENKDKSKEDNFESLTARCIRVITDNFAERPNLEGIPSKFLPQVTARLPLDLDITVTAPHIHDENYWKRACLMREVSNCARNPPAICSLGDLTGGYVVRDGLTVR